MHLVIRLAIEKTVEKHSFARMQGLFLKNDGSNGNFCQIVRSEKRTAVAFWASRASQRRFQLRNPS